MFQSILIGLQHLLTLQGILGVTGGTILGILFGSIPGLSSMTALALLLPFCYVMGTELAMVVMVGAYVGSQYGGAIPAVLFRTPGTSAAIMTALDGYPLAQQGRASEALAVSAIASSFGSFFSGLVLLFLAPQLASFALAFGPAEYFTLGLLALSVVTSMGTGNQLKALAAVLFGILISTIGLDPLTGLERFTFGMDFLITGIDPITALIGLFAVSEVLRQAIDYRQGIKSVKEDIVIRGISLKETCKILWKQKGVLSLASIIGIWIGILPGEGGTVASMMAYNEVRRWSKTPEKFGTGMIEGVIASESSNNAVVGGALVPTLALGIPGSASTALMLGAFAVHGIAPGPFLFTNHLSLFYTIVLSVIAAALLILIFGTLCVKYFGKIMLVPYPILASLILLFCIIGAYVLRNNIVDVWGVIVFGVLGYFMSKYGFPMISTTLGLIIGPIIEPAFGRTMIQFHGNLWLLFTRPISCIFVILAIVSLGYPFIKGFYTNLRAKSMK